MTEEKSFCKGIESTPQRLFPHKSFDRWKTVEAQYMTIEGARNIFQGFLAFLDGCTSSAKKDCHIDTLSSTTLSSCLKSCGIRFLGCAIGWYVRGCRECWKRFWQIERKPFESYLTVEKSYLAHMKFNSHPPHHSICEGRGTGDVWHALKIWIWNDSLNHFFINVQKRSCTKSMTLFSNVNCRHLSNGKNQRFSSNQWSIWLSEGGLSIIRHTHNIEKTSVLQSFSTCVHHGYGSEARVVTLKEQVWAFVSTSDPDLGILFLEP